ncbi:MAG: guanylate kinase [Verrucomicrobiota bacterium]|nr:guanylate kinase [Verrucomicrobiota bacterium]
MVPQKQRALLMIVSGPAGSGKTTLRERMIEAFAPNLHRVVTATTRSMRPGEVDGVDYHFMERAAFESGIAHDAFYEYAIVHGQNYYGGLKREIRDKLSRGLDLIMNVDVQGAEVYRAAAREDPLLRGRLVTVFIMPSSLEQLRERLSDRDAGKDAEIARRLQTAEAEINEWSKFDYCFTSGSRDADFQQLAAIFTAERLRTCRAE